MAAEKAHAIQRATCLSAAGYAVEMVNNLTLSSQMISLVLSAEWSRGPTAPRRVYVLDAFGTFSERHRQENAYLFAQLVYLVKQMSKQ